MCSIRKLFFIFYLLFTSLFAKALPPNSQGISIIPGSSLKAYTYTLNNGFKLIVIPDYRNTVATLNFILNAGSDREVQGATGLAHFLEHMMFRKTNTMPEGNYDRVLNSIGGSGNAGTSESLVTFYSVFPAPAIKNMLKLESQRFMDLSLMEPYFNIEKGAVISERKLRVENDPFQRGYESIRRIVERGTPLEWMVIGAKKDVENLNINTVKNFYDTFYTPNNTLLVVGGPFKPEEVKEWVTTDFSEWKGIAPRNNFQYPKDYLTRDLGKSFICSEPVETKNINFVYPSYDSSLKSVVYSWIFLAMLDDSSEGSFEYRLQNRKLADNFDFEKSYDGTKSNPITASFTMSPNQKIEPLKQFWDNTIQQLLNRPLTDKIVNQVIKLQKVYNADIAERLSSVVSTVTENAYFFHDPAAQEKAMEILQCVDTKDFSKWLKDNFSNKKYYIAGVVPLKEAQTCAAMLAAHQNK